MSWEDNIGDTPSGEGTLIKVTVKDEYTVTEYSGYYNARNISFTPDSKNEWPRRLYKYPQGTYTSNDESEEGKSE